MGLLERLLGESSAGTGRTWTPRNPEAVGRTSPLGAPADFEKDHPAYPWHDAPATSHLRRFRYIDTRDDRVQKRFIGYSELQVQFGNGTTYSYHFANAAVGKAIYQELKDAPRPGAVLDARLVKPLVPYERKV